MIGLIIIALLFLFIYLAVLRPQRRRRLEQTQRLQQIEPGAEVLTAGGIYGTVTGLEGDALIVEIAPSVQVRLDRRAIGRVIERPGPDELVEDDADAPAELEPVEDEARARDADGRYSDDR